MDKDEKIRYARQIAVEEIGREGQEKLLRAKVLVIGCGALGSMVAMQLAGAGIGKIGIADFDSVDISNLQRQFFFTTEEAGMKKAELLARNIGRLNPEVEVELFPLMITKRNAEKIFENFDFIVDATDNPESKKMTGEISHLKNKACTIAGVNGFSGQVMTFLPEDPRFEEFFGTASGESFLPCSLGGVMGPVAAVAASLQAIETIKYITEAGELLSGNILVFNLLDNTFAKISL